MEQDYQNNEEKNEEVYYDDDKFIAIIKTDGCAEIIEFDVEYWDKLPDYIAAQHLDDVRVMPLFKIAEELGLDDPSPAGLTTADLRKVLMKILSDASFSHGRLPAT